MADIFKSPGTGFIDFSSGFSNIMNAAATREELNLKRQAGERESQDLAMRKESHDLEMQTKIRDIQIAAQARNEFGEFNRRVLGILADPEANDLVVEDPYTGGKMIDETRGLVQMYNIADEIGMSPEGAQAAMQYIAGIFGIANSKVDLAIKRYDAARKKQEVRGLTTALDETAKAAEERRAAAGDKITPAQSVAIREQQAFSASQVMAPGGDFRATPEGQKAAIEGQLAVAGAGQRADWHIYMAQELEKAGYSPGQIAATLTGQVNTQLQTLASLSDMLRITPWENFPPSVKAGMETLIAQLTTQLSQMDDQIVKDALAVATGQPTSAGTAPTPTAPAAPEARPSDPANPAYWDNNVYVDPSTIPDDKQRALVFREQQNLKHMEKTYDSYLNTGLSPEEARKMTIQAFNRQNDATNAKILEAMMDSILKRKGNR